MSEIRLYHSDVPRPVGYCAECVRLRCDVRSQATAIASAQLGGTIASTFTCSAHIRQGELWSARAVIDHATGVA